MQDGRESRLGTAVQALGMRQSVGPRFGHD